MNASLNTLEIKINVLNVIKVLKESFQLKLHSFMGQAFYYNYTKNSVERKRKVNIKVLNER